MVKCDRACSKIIRFLNRVARKNLTQAFNPNGVIG